MAVHDSPTVDLFQVGRTFDTFQAVNNVSFSVERGTILGLIGPSGSGKTTVVRMVIGNLAPTEGRVRVLGERPERFRRRTRERIGYMPQSFILYPDLSARENLSFVGSLFGMLWPRRRRRSDELLRLLGLWDARDQLARRMSGGMQRRLALACALIHEPEIIFLDEPTAGIDPVLRQTIWEEFRRLRDEGRTLFVTTQYVGESEHCDRVAMLDHGGVVACDTPGNLRTLAFGGEMVEMESRHPIDGARMREIPDVIDVRQPGPCDLVITVHDAGVAIPKIIEAVEESNNAVASTREYRPSFDEVFAQLLERDRTEANESHQRAAARSA